MSTTKWQYDGKVKRLSGDFTNAPGTTSATGHTAALATFLSSLGQSISGSSPSSSISSSPSTTSSSHHNQSSLIQNKSASVIEMTDMGEYRKSVINSYTVRFIGSTGLRRGQTYPMLNWIITDLLYQSKCIGLDLSMCISNCLMKQNDQERLKQFQLLKEQLNNHNVDIEIGHQQNHNVNNENNQEKQVNSNANNGLVVRMDILNCSNNNYGNNINDPFDCNQNNECNNKDNYVFQICNPSDGQNLLRHKFSRIFLLGKYARQPCLFYYVHKSDDDVLSSVPSIYLFQALNSVQQTEICMKFNELRPKINNNPTGRSGSTCEKSKHEPMKRNATTFTDNSDLLYMYNPLLDHNQINVNNNCFEVRHVGSLVISQKRSTPSMIDRVAERLHQEQAIDQGKHYGEEPVEQQDKTNSEQPDAATDPGGSNLKPTVITTTGPSARRQYRKNRFLVQVIEENEQADNDNESHNNGPSLPQCQNNQNNANCDTEQKTAKVPDENPTNNCEQNTSEPNKTMLFIIGTMDICLISTENHRTVYSKVFANISHCSQGSKRSDHFGVIVREPYVPTATGNTGSDPNASISSSVLTMINSMPSSQCSSPSRDSNGSSQCNSAESYVLHVFQCQAESIVNDLLCSLRQSFNNAFRQSKASANATSGSIAATSGNVLSRQQSLQNSPGAKDNSPSFFSSNENLENSTRRTASGTFCHNCPMNWFHQLCLDIYGLDDVKIFAMLLHRIRHGSNERRWREYLTVFEYLQMDKLEQKVDLLVIMLKARVEKMQRYHEIRDGQCRMDMLSLFEQINEHDPVLRQYQQQKSTLSLNRLEGLRLMAKSSFDAFRKRNQRSNSQSNENLHPSGSGSPGSSMTNISTVHQSSPLVTDRGQQNTTIKTSIQRRNTVADCCSEDGTSTDPNQQKSLAERNLMDIYIKTSTGANSSSSGQLTSLQQLRDNLQQLYTDSNIFNDDSSKSTQQSNTNETLQAPNESTSSVQMRHRLFGRIRKTFNQCPAAKAIDIERLIKQQSHNKNATINTQVPHTIDHERSTKARQLWHFAIRKQIQLLKQQSNSSENQEWETMTKTKLNYEQESIANGQTENDANNAIMDRLRNLYEDIPRIETQSQLEMITLQWTKLIEMFEQYCHNNPDALTPLEQTEPSKSNWWLHYERSIVQALKTGVPKEIRWRVWKFLAKYRRYRNGSDRVVKNSKELYRSLLKQLAIHQHAIFVDLGRTFPTVAYFAEAMGPGQLALYNLLKAYSLLDKQVEYCQGLSFVAGILLLHMDEDDAFDQLCYVLYECGLREQYKPSMDALQMQMYQLNRLLYDLNRSLYDHLDRMDVSPTLYAAPSFLTLFASQYPIQFVSRVFDLLMFYGIEAIFRVFYHLVDRIQHELLSVDGSDFEACMQLMRTRLLSLDSDEMVQLFDRCLLMSTNNSSIDFHNRLEQYRLEYQILKEEFVHLNQINKLALEQKLQQQQTKQTIGNQRQKAMLSVTQGNIEQKLEKPEVKNADQGQKDYETELQTLREENRKLRQQNDELTEQNQILKSQLEELSTQNRRQSH